MNELQPISVDEHKKIQLDILKAVTAFCEDKGIRYYLADGTLIGAIRHNGFIPWDDDIDIEMPRPDFNRFKKVFENSGNLRLVAPGDTDSRFHCGKVIRTDTVKIEEGIRYKDDYLGVDIDIFVIDGCPNDEDEYLAIRKKIFKLYNIYAEIKADLHCTVKHRIKLLFMRIIYGSPGKIITRAFKLCEKYDFNNSKFIARYGRFGLGFRVPSACYSNYDYKDFENCRFRVPVGYDEILKAQFGDYMKLPPVNERITHHKNKVYWKDNTDK